MFIRKYRTLMGRQGTLGNEGKVKRSLSVCDVHMRRGNSG